jgi:hypothetical protein
MSPFFDPVPVSFPCDLISDQTEGLLWRLPDIGVIRQLSFDDPSEGTSKTSKAPKR